MTAVPEAVETGVRLRVAYQGEPGAFSEEAARALLGDDIELLPCPDFTNVGTALREGEADRAVLPVENSIHGSVTPSYDILAGGEFTALAQVVRPIHLCLAVLPGTPASAIRRVISHPVALGQCGIYLRGMPEVEVLAVHDTAGAARVVAERGNAALAAISSRAAAERYGLEVLEEGIQDRWDNQTRFLLIRRVNDSDPDMADIGDPAFADAFTGRRVLLLVDLSHSPGTLVGVLSPFARYGINLTSIQSRPAGRPWAYRFFIEAETAGAGALVAALAEVNQRALDVTVIGCYD